MRWEYQTVNGTYVIGGTYGVWLISKAERNGTLLGIGQQKSYQEHLPSATWGYCRRPAREQSLVNDDFPPLKASVDLLASRLDRRLDCRLLR